jgi:hypothetical protein
LREKRPAALVAGERSHGRPTLWTLGFLIVLVELSFHSPSSVYAQGGPPMLTDDPGTPGDGAWEINVAYASERADAGRTRSVPRVDVNYGLGDNIQLKYETGWLLVDGMPGGGAARGMDDSLLGLKWRFLNEERDGLDMSVYPQLEVESSSRAVAEGVAAPGPNLFLPIEVGRRFGRTRLVGEVGYQYLRAAENEWVVGLLGAFELSETREVMVELRCVGEEFLRGGDVVFNVGLRQEVGPRVRLLASVATGLANGAGKTNSAAYVGIRVSPRAK